MRLARALQVRAHEAALLAVALLVQGAAQALDPQEHEIGVGGVGFAVAADALDSALGQASQTSDPSMPSLPGNPHSFAMSSSGA